MNKRDFINSIREDYIGLKDRPRINLANSIEKLSKDLYEKVTHFIFELIQNAEDNDYSKEVTPSLRFKVVEMQLHGNPQIVLLVENNETGFEEKHVNAICSVGQSTKTKEQGYIGEKGIGFKSVFCVTSCPHIFSNDFRFSLPENDEETGIGYIVPQWIEDKPDELEKGWTSIILPINEKDEKTENVINALKDIAPETILFLKKIKSIEILISLPQDQYQIIIEKNDKKAPFVELTHLVCDEVETFRYWLASKEYEKPDYIELEKRKGVKTREISVAIPLDQENHHGKLFAYLPVWEHTALPFLINADFLLVSSREGILEDEEWNKWLRDCIAPVYTGAFKSFLHNHDLSESENFSLYASIPLASNIGFLECVVDQIHEQLSETSCIITEPEGVIALPSCAHLDPEFSDLVGDGDGYPSNLKKEIHLVHAEIERYSEQLEIIGVEGLGAENVLECLYEDSWLSKQSLNWFIRLYQYLHTNKQDYKECLKEVPIIPITISKSSKISLTSDSAQPIYSIVNDEKNSTSFLDKHLLSLVPFKFLNLKFQKLIEEQENSESLKKWMQNELGVYPFSVENYCIDILNYLTNYADTSSDEDLIIATKLINQFAGDSFKWEILPVILSNGSRVTYQKVLTGFWNKSENENIKVQSIVVPKRYDVEFGWQNIWNTKEDQRHFASLSDVYDEEVIDTLIKKGIIKKYPPPRKIENLCYYNIIDEYEKKCIQDAPRSTQTEKKITNHRPPSSLLTDTISNEVSKSLTKWISSNEFSASYKSAIVDYFFHRPKKEYYSSELLHCLKRNPWLPTTKGMKIPSQAFLPTDSTKEILGKNAPYFEGFLPPNMISLLGIRSELSIDQMLEVLKDYSNSENVDPKMIEGIYSALASRMSDDNHGIAGRFKKHHLILIQSGKKNISWHSSGECIWRDSSEIFGDEFIYLEKNYPRLKSFFVDVLKIKEKVDTEFYSNYWLKLQESPCKDTKKQRQVVEKLYREIRPVIKEEDEDYPDWWQDFISKAKIYTQSDTFEQTDNVVVPDDGELKRIFRESDVFFAWVPEKDSFSSWIPFYNVFGLSLLSESVSEELSQDIECKELDKNKHVTEAFVMMIASWLREKRFNDFSRLLEDGWFETLFSIKEAIVEENIHLTYTLENGSYLKEESEAKVYWDHSSNVFMYNKNAKTREIARWIARETLNNREFNEFAGWIESPLGESDTGRLNDFGWNVPREITALVKKKRKSNPIDPKKQTKPKTSNEQHAHDFDPTNLAGENGNSQLESPSSKKNESEDAHILDVNNKISESDESSTSLDAESGIDLQKDSNDEKEAVQETVLDGSSGVMSADDNNPTNGSKSQADKETNQEKCEVSDQYNGDEAETGEQVIQYSQELESSFNRFGATEFSEDFEETAYYSNSTIKNPVHRTRKLEKRHRENIENEPGKEERRKKTERVILEGPYPHVRQTLFNWYHGKCQICGQTWATSAGLPYFVAAYLVERKEARWLPGFIYSICSRNRPH
jgi:hypothetical protein